MDLGDEEVQAFAAEAQKLGGAMAAKGRGRGKGRDGRGQARGGYYDRTVEFDDQYVDPLFAEMEEDEEEEECDDEQLQLQYFHQPPVD